MQPLKAAGSGLVACLACPEGFYCPLGSSSPQKCAAGTYSVASSGACLNVPSGYAGAGVQSTLSDLVTCSNGTYSKPGQTHCSAVPAGFYCNSPSAPCGYKDLLPCPSPSVFCPKGNQGPMFVPPGYYSVGAKTRTKRSAILRCPPGFFCQNGAKLACPPSRFGAHTALTTPLCSGRCAAGCVCAAGSVRACPATPSSADQVVIAPAAISYALAPLTSQPTNGDDALVIAVRDSIAKNAISGVDLFEFKDVNASLFSTLWQGGFGHNVTITYFERSMTGPSGGERSLSLSFADSVCVDQKLTLARPRLSRMSLFWTSLRQCQ
uniref:Tyrosine-protein kinase ephrin type A/B receptor-like domain-containing protein n=1 Tax=Globisporangium ultimum (strain ATCC 200006 / CBS 805.95 / DAOM BR144) TaxID=431595 RepID=K3X1D6_GLOUD